LKNLQDFYQQTVDWNKKCGNKSLPAFTMEFDKAFRLQTQLTLDEVSEVVEAIELNDYPEILKETCDVLFTCMYMVDLLEMAGFDFEGAYQKVIDNNNGKVYNSFYEACASKEKLELRDDTEYFIETNVVDGLAYYVVVRNDGKVMKPVGFIPVDLSDFVPYK